MVLHRTIYPFRPYYTRSPRCPGVVPVSNAAIHACMFWGITGLGKIYDSELDSIIEKDFFPDLKGQQFLLKNCVNFGYCTEPLRTNISQQQ